MFHPAVIPLPGNSKTPLNEHLPTLLKNKVSPERRQRKMRQGSPTRDGRRQAPSTQTIMDNTIVVRMNPRVVIFGPLSCERVSQQAIGRSNSFVLIEHVLKCSPTSSSHLSLTFLSLSHVISAQKHGWGHPAKTTTNKKGQKAVSLRRLCSVTVLFFFSLLTFVRVFSPPST